MIFQSIEVIKQRFLKLLGRRGEGNLQRSKNQTVIQLLISNDVCQHTRGLENFEGKEYWTLCLAKPSIKNQSKIKIFLRHAKTQSLLPTYPSEEGIWGDSKTVNPIQKHSKEKSQDDSWGADLKSNWYKLE